MTLPYRGAVQFPGPLGVYTGALGGRLPGPLGFKQVNLGNKTTSKAAKSVGMPPPWHNSTPKRVRSVNWKLSNDKIRPEDVKQGGLPVCPVAAILAALAHTAVGQKYIDGLIIEYTGVNIKTVLSDEIVKDVNETADDPDDKPQDKEILSTRYFTVKKFWKGEIPDTLYVEYTDNSSGKPVFMGSPNEVLWPAIIEKACAFHWGSYREMGDYRKHTLNDHWEVIFGKKPSNGFVIDKATDTAKIRAVAEAASKVPAVAASAETAKKVTPWHGFAVMGMSGANIELYDPAHAKRMTLSLDDFRDNFQAIFYDSP
jgi:hypothetical protein